LRNAGYVVNDCARLFNTRQLHTNKKIGWWPTTIIPLVFHCFCFHLKCFQDAGRGGLGQTRDHPLQSYIREAFVKSKKYNKNMRALPGTTSPPTLA
jgi:hypothetical protein